MLSGPSCPPESTLEYPFVWGKSVLNGYSSTRVSLWDSLMFGRLAMGFANVRAGTRVLMLVLVQAPRGPRACTACPRRAPPPRCLSGRGWIRDSSTGEGPTVMCFCGPGVAIHSRRGYRRRGVMPRSQASRSHSTLDAGAPKHGEDVDCSPSLLTHHKGLPCPSSLLT